jgi:hypothetical protein
MGWGNGIGIGWPNASAGISYAKKLIKAFKERVLSYPNSIFEAEPCLDVTLTELNAIGLLEQASLVITPNAYNEGILYDVIPNTPLGDMDVVRATTATRVNELGLIEVVPRNLFSYSEEFNNPYWAKIQSIITPNSIASPNGTITANTFAGNGVNSLHSVGSSTVNQVGLPYTFTVYAKKNTNNFIQLSGNFAYGSNAYANFDLLNGVLGTVGSGATANIINVGNGWYRCILNLNAALSGFANNNIALITSATSIRIESNTLTTSVYIWGAQFEQGSLTEYLPTTTRLNIPRLDYSNGSCPSLLVEPQRTNLLRYSNDFSNAAWIMFAGPPVTPNSIISPDGLTNGTTLNSAGGANDFLYQVITTTIGVAYTNSFYIKNLNATQSQYLDVNGSGVLINWSGSTLTSIIGIGSSFVSVNNGWYRVFTTVTATNTSYVYRIYADVNNTSKSVYIYGAQLEAGSYPTSYIPTVASSVTRNADVISKTGISSLIGQTEGVFYFENIVNFKNLSSAVTLQSLGNSNDTDFIQMYITSDSTIYVDLSIGGVYITTAGLGNISSLNLGDTYKLAIQYNSLGIKTYKNGVLIQTSNSFIFSNFSKLFMNAIYSGSYINNKSAVFFKEYLSDQECINLTTL